MADCFKIINEISAGRLSDGELNDILERLNEEKRVRQARGDLQNLEADLFQRGQLMARDADLDRKIQKRNALINIIKQNEMLEIARRAHAATGNPRLGVEARSVGVNSDFVGAKASVDYLAAAIRGAWTGGFFADLKKANLFNMFNKMDKELQRRVSRVISDLNTPNPTRAADPSADVQRIAEIMFKYQRAALHRQNEAGAYISTKSGRVVSTSHNQSLMIKAGQVEWTKYIRDRLDYDRMDIRPERIDDFLESAWKAITTGVRLNDEIPDDVARMFKGPANLAKKRSAQGVFTFKNADDWFDYNDRFGTGDLREAYLQDLLGAARAVAVMENFGTNPPAMQDRVMQILEQEYRDDQVALDGLRGKGLGAVVNLKAALDEVTGDVNIGAHSTAAQVMHGYRAIQTMSKLGQVLFSALPDTAFIASSAVYRGSNIMDAWSGALLAPFRGMAPGEIRDISGRWGIGNDGLLGELATRFDANDGAPGLISKATETFFKLNLLQFWTEGMKRGAAHIIMNDLAREAGKSFDALPADLQRVFRQYAINDADWDVARKSARRSDNGTEYLFADEIENQRVRESFLRFLASEVDAGVLTPGARERSIMNRGYRPNSGAGIAFRLFWQFKSFGLTVVTKALGRHMYGYGAKNWREAVASGKSMQGIAHTIVATSILGYLSLQLKELAKGRDPRPHTPETFLAAMAQGGGLGIYGDFLFGEANRFGGGFLQTFMGPGIGTLADAVDLSFRIRDVILTGEDDARAEAIRFIKSNTPFANLFYTQQALDYLVWYQLQETVNPGYLRRMERRIERENDQTFWLRPSDVIATGGGFR
jgi:hypothetical protein